jgi:type IV secretion system protein VirD4
MIRIRLTHAEDRPARLKFCCVLAVALACALWVRYLALAQSAPQPLPLPTPFAAPAPMPARPAEVPPVEAAPYSTDQETPPAWTGFSAAPSTGALLVTRLLPIGLCAGLGFLVGAFFSPLMRRVRRYLFLAALVLGVAYALFGPYPAADIVSYFVAFIAGLVAFVFGLRLGIKAVRAVAGARRPRPTSFGSAKWADLPYLQQNGIVGSSGFALGEFVAGGGAGTHRMHYEGARHLLTVAPTRSGKGVSSIIPNLLTDEGSALVIDPKGENALITAACRGARLWQTIVLLDPWNIAAAKLRVRPCSFNPLDWITADDPDAVENAFLLADALVISNGQGEGRFWDDEAKALHGGMILFVATAPDEADNRTLGRVRDILTLDAESLNEIWQKMYAHPNPVVSTTGARPNHLARVAHAQFVFKTCSTRTVNTDETGSGGIV